MRRSKIVCTLGPAISREQAAALMEAGMDVARLNMSHGTHEDHLATLQVVRTEAEKLGRSVAVLLDLQGPKIRVGTFAGGAANLIQGSTFVITTDTSVVGDEQRVSTSYAALPTDVQVGDHLLLDDGYLTLEVTGVHANEVSTVVINGGMLKDRKGINLPNISVSAPALTEKDRTDLQFGLKAGVEYVALSFVRSPEDIVEARQCITNHGKSVPIIAKIEKPEAIEHLDAIIEAADGIMVARGDLGVELGPEKVPLIQKRIIQATNCRGKVVITATQMLESMIYNQRPSRAEASDIANAVLDGTDALMLSGETAVGKYPIDSVKTMAQIIQEVESSEYYRLQLETPILELEVSANAVAHAAVVAAQQMNIKTIAVITGSGGAARLMSEYRPEARIVALTTDEITYRRLALYWGVTPLLTSAANTTEAMLNNVEQTLREHGLAKSGEYVVITMGVPVGTGKTTNMLKVHQMS